ncbi:hypothetical protein CXB51_020317 [Gossypium anomalum]|uniref:Uncharacterized protein n=1 Tax=Gossypium anomalum TaxID=47600 RepID=A0A8J5YJA8_9ROSI|nr:hypothetical protein CXB51_020317 [Gossypium anomalum]
MRKKVRGFLAGKEYLASLHILQQTTLLKGIDGTALTAIVTGAPSGIGVETARVLALRGVHVVTAVRNLDAGRNVKEAILKEINGAKIDVMQLDLSSMASVRKFASEFQSSNLPLNILIAASSTVYGLLHAFTCAFTIICCSPNDPLHLLFACARHFLLTNLLLDTMKLTARESKREGWIVNLSSKGHRIVYGEGNPFDHINDESGYFPRFANILHANELSRRLSFSYAINVPNEFKSFDDEGVEITANSLHPGSIIMTDLMRHHGLIKTLRLKMKTWQKAVGL